MLTFLCVPPFSYNYIFQMSPEIYYSRNNLVSYAIADVFIRNSVSLVLENPDPSASRLFFHDHRSEIKAGIRNSLKRQLRLRKTESTVSTESTEYNGRNCFLPHGIH